MSAYSLSERLAEIRQENQDSSIAPLTLPDRWRHIEESLRGWVNGMIIIAGQANHGKSSLATNLALALLESNPNLVVLDISLDDDARNRISRYVASLSAVHINDVLFEWTVDASSPTGSKVLQRINDAYERLRSLEGRLILLDAGDIIPTTQSDRGLGVPTIEAISSRVLEVTRAIGPDRQLLLLLDSLNEVASSRTSSDILEMQRYVIGRLSVLSNQHSLRILATAHVRKDINWKNPNMNDIYGDSVIRYYAKAITFVYNDSKEQGGADNSVFSEVIPQSLDMYADDRSGIAPRIPIIAWIWKKSKISSFDGRYFMKFVPWSNTVLPVDPADNSRYDNLLNQELLPAKSSRGNGGG